MVYLNKASKECSRNISSIHVLSSSKNFRDSAKELAVEFGKKSTIHGMNRIFEENLNVYERYFWTFTLVFAFLGSIYVSLILSQRFTAGSLQTVVDTTNKPIYQIPFPEVTICNENHLNWQRIEEAKEHFMPHENNTEKIRLFEHVIGLYDNLEFSEFQVFGDLEGEDLGLVKDINFSSVFEFMMWRCEELLTDCQWHYSEIDCCRIFLKSNGLNGPCWHFNTLSTEGGKNKRIMDSKYPWRIGTAGPKTGLTLRVLINEEKHYRKHNEKGILVSIMEPEVYYKEPFWIPANTETAIEVDPVVFFYDNGTRRLSSDSRMCLFNDERNIDGLKFLSDFPYMFENCEAQCRQEYILKFCNCTMDLLFPPDKYPACNAEDLLCLAEYYDHFIFSHPPIANEFVKGDQYGMVCKCFRNCYSLNYNINVRPTFLPAYLRNNKTFVDLDIYFRFEKFMVYRTSLVFSWLDLMVAFGGIAGLFLGCSLISVIELLYFSLVELPVFVSKHLVCKSKI